jgi:hypothetical protein
MRRIGLRSIAATLVPTLPTSLLTALLTALLAAPWLIAGPAAAQTQDKTAGGFLYSTGAVTAEELRKLAREKDKYSLWVTTAAKGSGAFLSDAKVKILDAHKQNVVLDTLIVGPWLMVDLPPGTYQVETSFGQQTLKRTARIDRGEHNQLVLYFDSPADVSPDWVSPFKKSPYAE